MAYDNVITLKQSKWENSSHVLNDLLFFTITCQFHIETGRTCGIVTGSFLTPGNR